MLNDFQAYFDSKGIIYFTDLDGFPGNKHTKRKYVKKWTTICLKTMESVVNNTRKKFQQHEAKKDQLEKIVIVEKIMILMIRIKTKLPIQ